MRERVCAYCGERIHGKFYEMAVTFRRGKQSSVKKVDLHPECYQKVWEKCEYKEEGTEK